MMNKRPADHAREGPKFQTVRTGSPHKSVVRGRLPRSNQLFRAAIKLGLRVTSDLMPAARNPGWRKTLFRGNQGVWSDLLPSSLPADCNNAILRAE